MHNEDAVGHRISQKRSFNSQCLFKHFFKDLLEDELHDAKEGMRQRESKSVGDRGV